jgi:23S rRNA pseudouridine1911/1915/1917 synthase
MEILYEDNHIIAINKSVSEIVQADKTGDKSLEELLKEYIKEKYKKPGEVFLGVVHRIDRPVSGVVLFARTSKALTRLNAMFQEKSVEKTYWAIVKNKPPRQEDSLVHYLVRNTKTNKSYCHEKEVPGSKQAILHYRCVASSDQYHMLEIRLETGRHHQIRSQLATIGSPIRGDLKYGFPRSNKDGGISLHSRKVKFVHPVRDEELTIEAPVPSESLWNAFLGILNNESPPSFNN